MEKEIMSVAARLSKTVKRSKPNNGSTHSKIVELHEQYRHKLFAPKRESFSVNLDKRTIEGISSYETFLTELEGDIPAREAVVELLIDEGLKQSPMFQNWLNGKKLVKELPNENLVNDDEADNLLDGVLANGKGKE